MEIGEKIRTLRAQAGLSQTQLGAPEMTRAFISQVEHGKSRPSMRSLTIIASRLHKRIEYFLSDSDSSHEAIELMKLAEKQLNTDPQGAYTTSKSVLTLLKYSGNTVLEATAMRLSGRALYFSHQFEEAYDMLEEAVDLFRRQDDVINMCWAWYELGNCCMHLEEYRSARRFYEKAVLQSKGRKSLHELTVLCHLYSASSCQYIGDFAKAVESCEAARDSVTPLGNRLLKIDVGLAHGWVNYKIGRLDEAVKLTTQSLVLCRKCSNYSREALEQNLGIFKASVGHWPEAYSLWNRCLKTYESQNDILRQAQVLEEIARYWWTFRGDTDQAESICCQAIELLNGNDNSTQRGRIYRTLGELYQERGQHIRANELFMIAMELFRKVRAIREIEETIPKYSYSPKPFNC